MKIFITRNLTANSVLKKILTKAGYQVTGISLVKFLARTFQPISDTDWLFFYSKNGVNFFFEQQDLLRQTLPKLATMGLGTAQMIENRGYEVDFIGQGHPNEIAKAFGEAAKGQRVTFIRAENSKMSVQKAISDYVRISERIVYANYPIQNTFIPPHDILVFTSPLNTSTYLKYNVLSPSQKIFALGTTTAEKLHEFGYTDCYISPHPSEGSLAHFILEKLEITN